MRRILLISSLVLLSVMKQSFGETAVAKSLEDDAAKIAEYQLRCETINNLLVLDAFKLNCYTNYNHYGPSANRVVASSDRGPIKIANYNLLHPGTSKALFKDYAIIASIMDQYDILSGLELLATVGRDEQNNRAVIELLNNSEALVEKLNVAKAKLKDADEIRLIDDKIAKLLSDTDKAYGLYRAPGYFRVLQELKKLDPSWSLILSPRGDSALIGSVEELVGFYYRAEKITPANNPHCAEFAAQGAGNPYACFITLTDEFLEKNVLRHFARRPFMATFKGNGKKFTLVASHMVFTYSGDEAAEKDLMMKTFGVETYKGLGPGINAANFARFAEVKNTLIFMNHFRKKYKDDKIMLVADMNLVSNNAFWGEILKSFPGGELLINEATTLSPTRFTVTKRETEGVANDYDHFILDKSAFPECDNGKVYNYYKENVYKNIEKRYIIRQEVVGLNRVPKSLQLFYPNAEIEHSVDGDIPPTDDPATVKLDYPLTPAGQSKMDRFVSGFEKYLKNLKTVKNNEVVDDDFQIKERIDGMRRRVFLRQLTNPYYFRFMQEVLSDHFPVVLTCDF